MRSDLRLPEAQVVLEIGIMTKRILLVDDQAFQTASLGAALQRKGHVVLGENDPTKTLSAAKRFTPDLIVLDVLMGEMDGGKVAALLRADAETRNIPILFLTSLLDADETRAGIVLGGYPYLPKTDVLTLASYIDDLVTADSGSNAKAAPYRPIHARKSPSKSA